MLKSVKAIWASWAVINGLLLALVLGKNTTNEDIRYYFHGVNPDAPHQAGPDSIYKMSGPSTWAAPDENYQWLDFRLAWMVPATVCCLGFIGVLLTRPGKARLATR